MSRVPQPCQSQPRRQKKTVEKHKEKIIDNLVLKKTPKLFNVTKCRLIKKITRGRYKNYFPFRNKPIAWVIISVH